MTDFRVVDTIMGPTGLTAVFGMGTGVAPPVWSPGKRPRGRLTAAVAAVREVGHGHDLGAHRRGSPAPPGTRHAGDPLGRDRGRLAGVEFGAAG